MIVDGDDAMTSRNGRRLRTQGGNVCVVPVARAFVEHPQTHDVFQETNSAPVPQFVGHVRCAGCVAGEGLGALHTHQRPGAAGNEIGVGCISGYRDHGGCGVVRGHRHYLRVASLAHHGSRFHQRREQLGWPPPRLLLDDRPYRIVPIPSDGIQECGGGGVGDVGMWFATQPGGEQVRHEQSLFGMLEGRASSSCDELENGVELLELDTRPAVVLVPG